MYKFKKFLYTAYVAIYMIFVTMNSYIFNEKGVVYLYWYEIHVTYVYV